MRTVRKRILLVVLLGLLAAEATRAAHPNLIVIVSDDQGTNAVSAYGPGVGGAVSTPNIDRIANQGVRFSNAFGVDQVCAPNRATLLTGKYGHRNGVLQNGDVLDASQTTVADLLKTAGYRTAIIGKWHLVSNPGDAGFDYWNTLLLAEPPYKDPFFDRNGVLKPSSGYSTDLITADAIQWLDANRNAPGPFALFIMHNAPHAPYVPAGRHRSLHAAELPRPATFDDRWTGRAPPAQLPSFRLRPNLLETWLGPSYQALGKERLPAGLSDAEEEDWIYQQYAKDYLRTLAALDESVGLVLDYLEMKRDEVGRLADHTVVIYTGDNGNLVGEHFSFAKRRPYEEVLRVPLLMRGPGVPAGSVVPQTVINTDTAPTLLALAGAAIPGDMQGRSWLELLDGSPPADWRTSFYFNHFHWNARHVVPYNGIRTSRYKLIHHHGTEWGGDPAWELIDLEADPEERTNLYDDPQYAGVIGQLKSELIGLQHGLGITPIVTTCPGDMNYDGLFSALDATLARRCLGAPAVGACAQADLDGNAIVTANDVIRIGRTLGQTCPP